MTVLLDDKHNFMTKLRKDTDNALHLLIFEEILGVVEKYDPITGLNKYQVFHPLFIYQLMQLDNIKIVQFITELENFKHSDFIRNSKSQLIHLASHYTTSTHSVSLTSFEKDNFYFDLGKDIESET